MVNVIKYLWLGLLCVSINSYADGIDHDSSFYGKDVPVVPDQIDEWNYYQGMWMKKLPRVRLPNGHFMLDPHNINYWRDYDEWPCYYQRLVWPTYHGRCINPGEVRKDWHDIIDNHPYHNPKDVPEPGIIGLLGIGLLVMGIRSKVRRKL